MSCRVIRKKQNKKIINTAFRKYHKFRETDSLHIKGPITQHSRNNPIAVYYYYYYYYYYSSSTQMESIGII